MRLDKIMIRVSKEEKQLLDKAADDQALPTASWARKELVRTAKELVKNVATPAISTNYSKPSLLSLFCGPGGLDQGFKDAGFQTIVAIDNDKECVNTFKRNHPEAKVEQKDITKLKLADLDSAAGHTLQPVGVIGGPPCQSFSVSNVHQTEDDPRHSLPEKYASLLKQLNKRNPLSFFVFENVLGLLGKKHRHRYEHFKKMFENAGFKIYENILDARDYGVAQIRPRIFIVGINEKKHPNVKWIPPEKERDVVTVRDKIGGLPEPIHNSPDLDPASFKVHPNHWCMVPRSKKFEEGLNRNKVMGRCFRVLSWDEPSWTVAYGHREVHVHPEGHRRLSIYEAMLLQSFPPSYVFLGNISAQVRLVSEAVAPRMAFHLAQSIKKCLDL